MNVTVPIGPIKLPPNGLSGGPSDPRFAPSANPEVLPNLVDRRLKKGGVP
jgi:hypothetical protein